MLVINYRIKAVDEARKRGWFFGVTSLRDAAYRLTRAKGFAKCALPLLQTMPLLS
jgi:hypothetical protein